MSAFIFKFQQFQNFSHMQRNLTVLAKGLCCILVVFFVSSKSIAAESLNPEKASILWVSAYQDEKLDLELKGFNYSSHNQFSIDFIDSNSLSAVNDKLKTKNYRYIIAIADRAWQAIEPLDTATSKIGIGISADLFSVEKRKNTKGHYLISKEQPVHRLFALLNAMDFNHAQASALFYKEQQEVKKVFLKQAQNLGIPFKAINVNKQTSTIETINSIYNCCRVLLLKDADFSASIIKLKSLLFESYRRKIITIGSNQQMLKLGAMYAIYTEPHQLGQQAAIITLNLALDNEIDRFQDPDNFVIDSNHKIKNSIGGSLAKRSIGNLLQKTKLAEQFIDNREEI